MKRRKTLVIWRDDHLADSLGGLFLVAPEQIEGSIVEKLRQYLGHRVKVLQVVVSGSKIEVETESQGLPEESDRLVAAASALRANGLTRSAMVTLGDALELDPLNGSAYREIGATLAAADRHSEAFAALIRARETLGDSAELLTEIAGICVKLDRISAAIVYLKRALKLEPRNFIARRFLSDLRRNQRSTRNAGKVSLLPGLESSAGAATEPRQPKDDPMRYAGGEDVSGQKILTGGQGSKPGGNSSGD